jgi:hypothetical protein
MSKRVPLDIRLLYLNVVDENQPLNGAKAATCCKKLSKSKMRNLSADNLCHTLVLENDGLVHELGSLRQRLSVSISIF